MPDLDLDHLEEVARRQLELPPPSPFQWEHIVVQLITELRQAREREARVRAVAERELAAQVRRCKDALQDFERLVAACQRAIAYWRHVGAGYDDPGLSESARAARHAFLSAATRIEEALDG